MVCKVIFLSTDQTEDANRIITEFYQADTPGHENEQARA